MKQDILEQIVVATKVRVEKAKQQILKETLVSSPGMSKPSKCISFYQALKAPGMSFICEIKKSSPSKGLIAEDFPYLEIAMEYEAAGASAISVLTEPVFFKGSHTYLKEVSANVGIPTLRKDFIIDEYQIYEAKALGAAAVLLICSILSPSQLKAYLELARSLGLDALVEAHSSAEVAKAVAAGAQIIGVNNRDLKDFSVDINHSINLRKEVPDSCLFVSESGIRHPADVRRLEENSVDAVLIGEQLMRSSDKKRELQRLGGMEHGKG
ncbi:indole-3-glycerol phosphate synthase [Lachnospiraceae bacterium PF1-21]